MRHVRFGIVVALLSFLVVAPVIAQAQSTPEATTSGTRTFALPGDNVFPEGVAHQEGSDEFFVGATGDGTIFRGDLTSGEVTVFSEGGADGRVAAIGMKVDSEGQLIVAGGPTGLVFAYDTTTGELLRQASTGTTEDQFLNDVVITPSGDAYITDSMQPVLYRLPALPSDSTPEAAGTLEPFLDFTGTDLQYQEGFNLNGIVASADGAYLLVVQSNTGSLYRIDVATKMVQQVDLGGGSLMGGDGMVLDGTTLYVVNSGKVTVGSLSDDLTTGTIDADFTDPSFSSPTTAAKAGDCLLVVNSQFANRGGTPQLPFTVSEVLIPASIVRDLATPPSALGC